MYRSILKDIEFGDAVASRGRQRGGGAGKDWTIAEGRCFKLAVPLLTDYSLELTKSQLLLHRKYDSILVVVKCVAFSISEASC